MKLTITNAANEQLNLLQDENHSFLRLFYDTEGLGCGVNGQPTIRLTDTMFKDSDKAVENEKFNVIIDRQQSTFFKPEMKLDFTSKGFFRLSSPEGVLNPIIPTGTIKNEVPL
ncbi:iron-sulfur cluster biosynthesis family protein [Halobacillus naozhouensis]|uniref:Iron-sulfur cluster biosynthesis family protein n=1 Tax=Halobacillus naozhouensis TaxID=554880 RepID=A0ABY8IX83_9BACI|nr:iron-sulfur cluster biosynthesis family protein [Halobacillus naozhouensis]WFT73175.1 iron-sulfur cluster biosynthesis family protein [Halobacillus naozhouensis]